MTMILLLAAGWLLALAAWVGLKLRQPKLTHPVPPGTAYRPSASDSASAAGADMERPTSL